VNEVVGVEAFVEAEASLRLQSGAKIRNKVFLHGANGKKVKGAFERVS
jgi:hypothetical protein